ncbi:MAG: hypothetical protein AAGC46_00580 [Solirubrobacteraceae bacterium]|nr:hypothetical protein [Patulibacter sp.]
MPLRKQRPILKAAGVAIVGAALIPATASAGILSFLTPAKTTTTTTTAAATTATVPSTATSGSTTCTPLPTTKAFQAVDGDSADYSVAPAGTFESGATGWTLTGSAAVATGNESLGISSGSKSLRLPLGATATSPEFCVDETNPHFRFAYKVDNVGAAGFVAYVIYRDAAGAVTKTQLLSSSGLSIAPSAWQASPSSPLATIIPLSSTNKSASVQLKFVASSPADMASDITTAVVGTNAISGIVKGATGIASSATNIGTGIASNVVNVGVSIDSVMVDPYRRG